LAASPVTLQSGRKEGTYCAECTYSTVQYIHTVWQRPRVPVGCAPRCILQPSVRTVLRIHCPLHT
jgi:hypothetical protein